MNWLHRKMPTLVSALAIILIAVIGCRKEDSQIITDELRVSATNAVYRNPLNIQIFDAKNDDTYPENATVTAVGKDRHKILSVLGERILPIKNGMIEIGVRGHDMCSEERPLDFSLIIEAPGYVKTFKSYYLTSSTEPMQDVVRLFRLIDLPNGVEMTAKTATIGTNGQLPAAMNLTTTGLSVQFKAGTLFRSAMRRVLTGDVKMTLVRFDASKETALDGFPSGLAHDKATNERNRDLGEGIFTPYGFYQLEVTVGGVPAKSVSKSIEVTMDIPTTIKRGLNDSNTPISIQAGNTIDFWSFDESESQYIWHQEGNTRVLSGGSNNLQVKFEQSHLSYWAVADRRADRACSNAGFRANYTRTPSATPSTAPMFFVKVRSAHNPQMTLGSFYANFSGNPFINLRRIVRRTNKSITLDIYDNVGGTLLQQVTNIIPCNRQAIDLTPLEAARRNGNYMCFNINMNVICRNGTQVRNFRPFASLYAAVVTPSGVLRYRYIGTMDNGVLKTCLLRRGVPYVFKLTRGPLSGTTIDLNNAAITFPTDRAIRTCTLFFTNATWGLNNYPVTANVSETDPDTFVFLLPNFEAPAYLCNKWFQYF